MKIAVISDLHGNSFALSKVLSIAREEKADKLLVLGDICGYYYHPDRIMRLLNEWDYSMIRGNHENLLLRLKKGEIEGDSLRKKYGSGHNMALAKLGEVDCTKITHSPERLDVEFDGLRIAMCHGSPMDSEQYLYPDTDISVLQNCDLEYADLVLVGHSHYPFVFRNRFSTLINCGSVGQSRDTGGIASWVMINTTNRSFEIKSTPYDTAPLIEEVMKIDPDIPYLSSILSRKRS